MRCTHYMKEMIINQSAEKLYNQYIAVCHSPDLSFTMTDNNIINSSVRELENTLSIDRIEIDNELFTKILHKARGKFYAKVLNYTTKGENNNENRIG